MPVLCIDVEIILLIAKKNDTMAKINHLERKEIWVFLSHSNEDYEKVRRVRNIQTWCYVEGLQVLG